VRRTCGATLLVLALAAAEPPADAPSSPGVAEVRRLQRGMTRNEVRKLAGPPLRVVRQVLFNRYVEQWVYEQPVPFRVEFDCKRGEEPFVSALKVPPSPGS
jgi:hypothetical protein